MLDIIVTTPYKMLLLIINEERGKRSVKFLQFTQNNVHNFVKKRKKG